MCILGVVDLNRQVIADFFAAQPLYCQHLFWSRFAGDVDIVHGSIYAHAPAHRLEAEFPVHNSREEMLAGVLLHVIKSTLPVHRLAHPIARLQRFWRINDALQTFALDFGYRDRFRFGAVQQIENAMVPGLPTT